MNWTGGRLQRHFKNSNNAVVNRQKAHFAKLRQSLQNGESHQRADFQPDFVKYDGLSLVGSVNSLSQSSQRQLRHSRDKQTKLETYLPIELPAHRLASTRKRALPSRKQYQVEERSSLNIEPAAETSVNHSQDDNERHGPSLQPSHRKAGPHFNYTLSPRRKRQRKSGPGEDTLESSRRRLLQQDDWVGLAPSKPLQMQFTSRKEKEQIGKRRKIGWDTQTGCEKFGGSKSCLYRNEHQPATIGNPTSRALGATSQSISIRIGEDALVSQVYEKKHEIANIHDKTQRIQQGSDMMLFDAENFCEGHYIEEELRSELSDLEDMTQLTEGAALAQSWISNSPSGRFLHASQKRTISEIEPLREQVLIQTRGEPNREENCVQMEVLNSTTDRTSFGLHAANDQKDPSSTGYERRAQQPVQGASEFSPFQDVDHQLVNTTPAECEFQKEAKDQLEVSSFFSEDGGTDEPLTCRGLIARARLQAQPQEQGTGDTALGEYEADWVKSLFILAARRESSQESILQRTEKEDGAESSAHSSTATTRTMRPNTSKACQSQDEVGSSVHIRQSCSTSLQHIMQLTECQIDQPDHDSDQSDENELWRKFVFGEATTLSTPSFAAMPHMPAGGPRRKSLTSSLFIGLSRSSSSAFEQAYCEPTNAGMNGSHSPLPHNSLQAARPIFGLEAWADRSDKDDKLLSDATVFSMRNNPAASDATTSFRTKPSPAGRKLRTAGLDRELLVRASFCRNNSAADGSQEGCASASASALVSSDMQERQSGQVNNHSLE